MIPKGMHFWYWLLGWFPCRMIGRFYFRSTILHVDRVPATGGCILAGNHASFFDPFLLGSSPLREISYLARASAFWFPMGAYLRVCNAVPMDREGGGLKGMLKIIDILKKGNGITLFPEGTRTRDGKLQPAKAGIGLIVIKSGAPVVPVRIFGSYEAWNRHMIFPRPRPMTVKYGHPINFDALRKEAETCSKERLKQIYQEVSDRIMAEIGAMQPTPDPE
jgi:1-acyl-sn-glycerol-3-phosphate acyltransferase